MKQVYKNLFVGSQEDYENNKGLFANWAVIHACKYPYHKEVVGYKTASAPKGPLYYYAYDKFNHLSLNMIDVESSLFFADEMIDEAIEYCIKALKEEKPILIHCNKGESRAPCLAMMILRKIGYYKCSFAEAVLLFRTAYPDFNPKSGIYEYSNNRWDDLLDEN